MLCVPAGQSDRRQLRVGILIAGRGRHLFHQAPEDICLGIFAVGHSAEVFYMGFRMPAGSLWNDMLSKAASEVWSDRCS